MIMVMMNLIHSYNVDDAGNAHYKDARAGEHDDEDDVDGDDDDDDDEAEDDDDDSD